MEIQFRTNKLENAYRNTKFGVRLLGDVRHKRFVQRIDLIGETQNIEELSRLPVLHWHSLHGDRAGQYAVTLIGNWRLILTLVDNAPNTVSVEEVIDYHGD